MRLEQLATEPVNLTLYTLADGERTVDGLETAFAALGRRASTRRRRRQLAELFGERAAR